MIKVRRSYICSYSMFIIKKVICVQEIAKVYFSNNFGTSPALSGHAHAAFDYSQLLKKLKN